MFSMLWMWLRVRATWVISTLKILILISTLGLFHIISYFSLNLPIGFWHIVDAVCSFSQVAYKKDAKASLSYTTVVDRPDIKKATQAAKLISQVTTMYMQGTLSRLKSGTYALKDCMHLTNLFIHMVQLLDIVLRRMVENTHTYFILTLFHQNFIFLYGKSLENVFFSHNWQTVTLKHSAHHQNNGGLAPKTKRWQKKDLYMVHCFFLVPIRLATVRRPVKRQAAEVLWPTAQTLLWPLRCQSWPARYTKPNQPSVCWSPESLSSWFSTVFISYKMFSCIYITYKTDGISERKQYTDQPPGCHCQISFHKLIFAD